VTIEMIQCLKSRYPRQKLAGAMQRGPAQSYDELSRPEPGPLQEFSITKGGRMNCGSF
jgi:hypothetical protein